MPVSALTGEQHRPLPARTPSDQRWDRIRHVLIIGWLVVIVATPVTGERTSSWDEVRSLVAAGEVDTVRVTGELPSRASGYGVVDVHWRHGLLSYTAQVVHVRGQGRRLGAKAAANNEAPVVRTAPSSHLAALQPGLQVTRDQRHPNGGQLFGFQVPSALAITAFLLFVVGLGHLVGGPQPWRATRWGWFWLLLPPFGSVAYLVLAGPTPGVPGPRGAHRRLTGGWAFLLSLPLRAVLAPYRG